MSDASHSSAEFGFHWSSGIAKQLMEHVLQRSMRPQAITSEELQFLDGAPLGELRNILQGMESKYGLRKMGEAGGVMDMYVLLFADEAGKLCLFEFDGTHGASIGHVSDSESLLYVHDHPNIRKSPAAKHVLEHISQQTAPEKPVHEEVTLVQQGLLQKLRKMLPSWMRFGG